MFGSQIERLQRKRWKDPNELAQEIAAILGNPRIPLSHEGPITLTLAPGATSPQIRFRGGSEGSTPMEFVPREGDSFTFTFEDGTLHFDGEAATAGTAGRAAPAESTTSSANSFPGEVLSGSGESYEVQVLDGETVSATCLGIDADEEVPAGTFVTLVLHGGAYYFTVPLWL